jgi:hypothetical protein
MPSARNQGVKIINGLDSGELGMCVIEIPTEDYERDIKSSSEKINQLAVEYMTKVVSMEITEIV